MARPAIELNPFSDGYNEDHFEGYNSPLPLKSEAEMLQDLYESSLNYSTRWDEITLPFDPDVLSFYRVYKPAKIRVRCPRCKLSRVVYFQYSREHRDKDSVPCRKCSDAQAEHIS